MKNGVCVEEADTDSDDDFEYVSGIATYRILSVFSRFTEPEWYILILRRDR